jgi:hypothetical protein
MLHLPPTSLWPIILFLIKNSRRVKRQIIENSDRISSSTKQETEITIWTIRNCDTFCLLFVSLFLVLQTPPPTPVGHGLLIHEVSRSHTTRHIRYDSSGRVIRPSQIPLSDNTQHSQQTSMPPVGLDPKISARERPQTYALDRAATGTGLFIISKYY